MLCCGSEGTLAFVSEAVINLEPLTTEGLVAVQYEPLWMLYSTRVS